MKSFFGLDVPLQYLRSGKGSLTPDGQVVQGGRTAFCEAKVHDDDGQLVARAIGTFAVRARDAGDRRSGAAGEAAAAAG